jgi:hypothetical protein
VRDTGRPGARRRAGRALAALAAAAVVAVPAATGRGGTPDPIASGWRAQSLETAATPADLQNNLTDGALARRDRAEADWRAAVARYEQARGRGQAAALRPDPAAKPEYLVVWAGHANASDENQQSAQSDAGSVLSDPLGAGTDKRDRFVPGLDGFVVLDARKDNIDGSPNPDYGKVTNFVQLPLPWGLEGEPHHMQYQWEDGQALLAGGLFNDTTWVVDVSQVPQLGLRNTITPQDTPTGTVPDAYDAAGDGRFIGTYMGGPEYNFAGSPGEVVTFKPDKAKGYVVASETPAGVPDARDRGNPGGVPEPCGQDESAPLNTCANPHGIQVRPDLGRMVTSDYAEPKMVVLDPAKPSSGQFFRPTVRVWDTANPDHPKLLSVAHMPRGWRAPSENTMHTNRGVMENAKTWPQSPSFSNVLPSKGFFAGSMCGGGVFFTPDVTKLAPDSTRQWNEVFDDGIALMAARHEPVDQFLESEGPCEGGAWTQVSRNNRWLFRAVTGQAPNIENDTGPGQPAKVIYDIDVQPLIESAQDGRIACNLTRGIDTDGDGKIDLSATDAVKQIAEGRQVADCPRLISTLTVDDTTSGGPHWAALDNHSLTPDGFPTRLAFSDYFVARSGVDGDHRLYVVDIDPASGRMSYDTAWRDEVTGRLGTNFNRRDWPGNAGAGFYKPHSMVWVCPPGICPADQPGVGVQPSGTEPPRAAAPRAPQTAPASSTTRWSGTCTLKGTVQLIDPYQLVPETRRWFADAKGTCTGTLNGHPYNGPAELLIDGRMGKPMSCEGGISTDVPTYLYFNSSPTDVNATELDLYNSEFHVVSEMPVYFYGAYNGSGAGRMDIQGSPLELTKCLGPGVSVGHWNITFRTLSQMYG